MKKLSILFAFLFFGVAGFCQQVINLYDGTPPNAKKTDLREDIVQKTPGRFDVVLAVANPTLTIYLPPKEKATGAAIIVCPGGGYRQLALSEGDTMAKRFAEKGIAGIVLRYRLPNADYVDNKEIVPFQDAQHALIVVRNHAATWGIDPNRVGMMGSSAGGHLVSTMGTHFNKQYDANPGHVNVRPDFLILDYPVISFADSITHMGSRFNLVGPVLPSGQIDSIESNRQTAAQQLAKYPIAADKILEYSNELQVTPATPPTFIIHANDDKVVPIQNSILFIAALQKNGVEVKPFFYAHGGHGFGLNNRTSNVQWFDACIKWLDAGGWLKQGQH